MVGLSRWLLASVVVCQVLSAAIPDTQLQPQHTSFTSVAPADKKPIGSVVRAANLTSLQITQLLDAGQPFGGLFDKIKSAASSAVRNKIASTKDSYASKFSGKLTEKPNPPPSTPHQNPDQGHHAEELKGHDLVFGVGSVPVKRTGFEEEFRTSAPFCKSCADCYQSGTNDQLTLAEAETRIKIAFEVPEEDDENPHCKGKCNEMYRVAWARRDTTTPIQTMWETHQDPLKGNVHTIEDLMPGVPYVFKVAVVSYDGPLQMQEGDHGPWSPLSEPIWTANMNAPVPEISEQEKVPDCSPSGKFKAEQIFNAAKKAKKNTLGGRLSQSVPGMPSGMPAIPSLPKLPGLPQLPIPKLPLPLPIPSFL